MKVHQEFITELCLTHWWPWLSQMAKMPTPDFLRPLER